MFGDILIFFLFFFFFFMVGTSVVGARLGRPGEAIRMSTQGTCFCPVKGGTQCC